MATEAPRAPRVVRDQTNMADAAALLNKFKLNDVSVFDTSPADLTRSAMEQAHALTLLLSTAIEESTGPSGDTCIRMIHLSRAIDAVGTLVALAGFALEGASS